LTSTQNLEDFFVYSNYTDIFDVGYDVLYDYQAPSYFYPSNCNSDNSFNNEVPSTIIAIVGENTTVSNAVYQYLNTLFSD
jgi:hypothetical protein